jgi:hypothetical protein
MPINNFTPEQRKAVRRLLQALALVAKPERRVIIVALKEVWQITIAPFLADFQQWQIAMAPVLADIERRMAKEDAVRLALEERLGHEPEEGETITYQDELRAKQIFLECWRDLN